MNAPVDPRAPLTRDDVYRGRLVTWLHVPRGGYGYVMPIDAKVIDVRGQKAEILVEQKDGRKVCRWVKISSLRNTEETASAISGASYAARAQGGR